MSDAMATSLEALRANQAATDALLAEHAAAVAAAAARARARGAVHVAARAAALAASPVAGFWGRALKAHPLLGMAITPRDAAVLAHLTDVRDVMPGDPEGGGEGAVESAEEEAEGGAVGQGGGGATTAGEGGGAVGLEAGEAGTPRDATRTGAATTPTDNAADVAGTPGAMAPAPEAGGEPTTPAATAAALGVAAAPSLPDASAPWTFSLHFHFDSNPFFTNRVLTKTYTFAAAGPVGSMEHADLVSCEGTPIDWAPDFAHLALEDDSEEDDDGSNGDSTAAAAAETAAMLAELFDADLRMATAVADGVIPGAVHLVGGTFETWRGGRPYRECMRDQWDLEDSDESD
ncbi:hypothetical protein I4F81_002996 [Pyropia yezoensis]|uniref:Uncharacterized protein n=1 Tax=Pyropia yezoensis TaxID=2788 RepID=A0ACC3BRC2_PYRYE|nr:hypothetical protein I4F81_002996 [Neopyropia yezoensis]